MTPTHTRDHVNPEAATTERPVFGNPLGTPSIYYPRHYRKTTLASGRGLGKTNPSAIPSERRSGAMVWSVSTMWLHVVRSDS